MGRPSLVAPPRRAVRAYLTTKLQELVAKFDIATEVRGVGMIQALQLMIPGKPVLEGAMADSLLFNITQDTLVRFLRHSCWFARASVELHDASPGASGLVSAQSSGKELDSSVVSSPHEGESIRPREAQRVIAQLF
jgi:hypothetical protein